MGQRPDLGFLVGLQAEARIAQPLGQVAIGGGTAAGATHAAEALAGSGVAALISFGLAGGLDPALRPGDLVIPAAVLADGRTCAANPALTAALHGPTHGLLYASARVIATAAEKTLLFQATGAQAVDLESGAVMHAARRAGLPWAVLRVVCDPAERDLPPAALVALSHSGAIGSLRVLGSVLRHPGQIPALLALAADAARGRRALQAAAL